jgi:hypothetical protein
LLVQYVARQQDLTITTNERAQIENVCVQADAMRAKFRRAPSTEKKIATPVTSNESGHRRMIARAKTNHDVLDRRHTLAI